MIAADRQSYLERTARERVLLVACDCDGTLSPLVSDPAAAAPEATALAALQTR